MGGHGGSNAVAGDTHDEGNKAGGGKRRESGEQKIKSNHIREARHKKRYRRAFF